MKHAFSLVELSIVLVILGLLTGGILTGQSLIRAAELRSVTSEFNNYQTAIMTFRDKYFALPGDMNNAQSFWGIAHATPATCGTTASTGTETCNGDGDGNIESTSNSSTGSHEKFRFWQHLANAGLVEGTYTGIAGSTGNDGDANPGINVPTSKAGNGGWHSATSAGSGSSLHFAVPAQNILSIGADAGTGSNVTGALFTPEEVWNIDKKIDDGRPGYGKVMAIRWDDCTDATSFSDLDSDYLLSTNNTLCAIRFVGSY